MTQFTDGGGCSCKMAAADLEAMLAAVFPAGTDARVLVGLESGDDATVVQLDHDAGRAIVATTDFFPPVVDDAFEWGRIAAANALSDVWAMGGEPLTALNLLSWPAGVPELTNELAAEVLRGGRAICEEAGCIVAGGHSIRTPTPIYGLAVTGLVDPGSMLRCDTARPSPITLTKPIGVGILNNRHKSTGEWFPEALDSMTTLNREAARAAVSAGALAATDVTGFGLLGHLHKMARASGVTAVIDRVSVPVFDGARASLLAGYVPGGSRANLDWVRPWLESSCPEEELLLLADAQTSGGLLVAGEVPGYPVIGEFVKACGPTVVVR